MAIEAEAGRAGAETAGAEIRRHRGRLGLTLEEFAGRLGVTPRAVQYWEAGTRTPGATVLPVVRRLRARKR